MRGIPRSYFGRLPAANGTTASGGGGTAELCSRFAMSFGAEELGKLAGLAHDIGKYSDAFQRRLQGGSRVDHATAGAYECRGQPVAAFCVMGHHGGLPDGGSRGDSSDLPTFWGRMRRASEGKLEPYTPWAQEVSLPSPQSPAFQGKSSLLDAFFFTRMLYSCLVDADFLDTERFMAGETLPRGSDVPMEVLYHRLEQYIAGWFPPSLSKPPTFFGKYWARKTFWSTTPMRSMTPALSVPQRRETAKQMRATENWDMPVIVTTAVQFFESLYLVTSQDIQQRASLLLRDVRYVIEAHFDIVPEKAAADDNPGKFQDIATRRINKGQFYHQPCFGCREFPAHFAPCQEIPPCPDELRGERDLGYMLYDMDYTDPEDIRPLFFRGIASGITRMGSISISPPLIQQL